MRKPIFLFLPILALNVLTAARPAAAQTSTVSANPLLTESNTDVEVTFKSESVLKLFKKHADGTEAAPFKDEHSRRYRVITGFDANDKPVATLRILNQPNQPDDPHVRAKTITLRDGKVRMFDTQNRELTAPEVPGVVDARKVAYLSYISGASLFRLKSPSDMAYRTKSDLQLTDANTAVLTSHPSNDQTTTSALTFSRDPDGKWTMTKREFMSSSNLRSLHETTTFHVVKSYTNAIGDARRRSAELSAASVKANIESQKVEIDEAMKRLHGPQPVGGSSLSQRSTPVNLLGTPGTSSVTGTTANTSPVRLTRNANAPLAANQTQGANGANVAFVHGLESNGGTWSTMQPWLNSDFQFNSSVTPSIGNGGSERLNSWAPELTQALNPAGYPVTQPYIAIGHSAGGLVSRAVAQNSGSPIYGVVTLDTPHLGSDLLTNLQADSVKLFLRELFSSSCYYDYSSCLQVGVIGSVSLAGISTIGAAIAAPATLDLEAPNFYEISLNSNPESFPRTGLVGISDPNWISFRTLTDFAFGGSGPGDGQTAANAAGYLDDALYAASYAFYGAAGYYYFLWEQDDFDPNDGYGDLYYQYLGYGDQGLQLSSDLESFDNFWNAAATCNINQSYCDPYGSDGVVQGQSQVYPNAPNLFMAGFDGSHTTSTRSQVSRSYLDQVLTSQMFAPPQVCNSSASSIDAPGSTTIPVPFQGGVLSFSVSDPSGCNWSSSSALPSGPADPTPWFILYGSPGASAQGLNGLAGGNTNGTVQVLVSFNQTNSQQQATVTIAGTTFTLVQDAAPSGLPQGTIWLNSPFGQFSYPIPTVEYLTVTVGNSTYNIQGVTWQVAPDSVAAAAQINADPSSPVVAGVWRWGIGYGDAGNAAILLMAKSPQSAGLPFNASVTATAGVPCGLGFCMPPQAYNVDFFAYGDAPYGVSPTLQ